MTFRPIAYLRDVGSEEDPCYIPCAQGDDGSLGVYTLEQLSEANAALAEALTAIEVLLPNPTLPITHAIKGIARAALGKDRL